MSFYPSLATQDVDLIWDARRRVQFVDAGLLMSKSAQQETNRRAFIVGHGITKYKLEPHS